MASRKVLLYCPSHTGVLHHACRLLCMEGGCYLWLAPNAKNARLEKIFSNQDFGNSSGRALPAQAVSVPAINLESTQMIGCSQRDRPMSYNVRERLSRDGVA